MNKTLTDLLENKQFIEKMLDTDSVEDVISLFSEHNITITAKEVEIIKNRLENPQNRGELSEQDLSIVAGGGDINFGLIDDALQGFIKLGSGLFDRLAKKGW